MFLASRSGGFYPGEGSMGIYPLVRGWMVCMSCLDAVDRFLPAPGIEPQFPCDY